jgi:hypothetical protein
MKNNKYPEGYLPKIRQNINRLLDSQKEGDVNGIRYALAKLGYFAEREAQRIEALELPQLEQDED